MAKRKKLNKRVVIFLIVLGGIFAVGVLAVIISRLPKDPTALAAKAQAALDDGNYAAAVKNYMGAAKEAERAGHPLAPEYYYELARTCIDWALKDPELTLSARREKYAMGRNALETSLRLDPTYVDAQKYLCELMWSEAASTGRWREYVEQADKLLKLAPNDDLTYFRRAQAKGQLAQTLGGAWLDDAIADFRKAVKLKPEATDYWRAMIGLLLKMDKRDAAEQALHEAIAANPGSAEIRAMYARYLRLTDQMDAALEQINKAIEAEPDAAAGYLELCDYYYTQDDIPKAFEALDRARAAVPNDVAIYAKQARLYLSQRQSQQAQEVLQDGLKLLEQLAAELAGKQDDESARQLQKLRRYRVELNYLLADVLLDSLASAQDDQKDEIRRQIEAALQQVRRVAPDSPQAKKIAGRLALYDGKLNDAIEQLRAAHDGFLKKGMLDPKTATLLISLYDKRGNPGEADHILDQILMIPTQRRHAPVLLLKARREMQYRRYDKALTWVKEALRVDPNNEQAKQLSAVLAAAQTGGSPEEALAGTGQLSQQALMLLLERAQTLWIEEQRDQAIELLENLLVKAPDDLNVIAQLARMYSAEDRNDQAIKLLDEAEKRLGRNEVIEFERARLAEPDPQKQLQMLLDQAAKRYADDPLRAALAQANICAAYRQPQKELEYLRQAESIDPNSPAVIQRLFTYAIRQKDWDLAEKCASKGAEMDLDGLKGMGMKIRIAQAQGQYDKAIQSLKEVLQERPDVKTGWATLGDCYMRTKQYDLASEAYQKAVDLDPGFAPAVIGLARSYGQAGDWTQNERWVRRAYQLPAGRRDPYIIQMYLNYEERDADDQTISEKIIPARERLAKLNPQDMLNQYRLAMLYERLERFKDAEATYRKMYETASDKLTAAKLLAAFYVRSKESTEVDRLFSDMLSKAGSARDKAEIWEAWSEFLRYYSTDQALRALNKALEVDPTYTSPLRAKARLLARRRDWDGAIEAMKAYLDTNPPDAKLTENDLILYMIKAGRQDEAIKRIDDALAANPADAHALTLKGIVAWEQSDLDKAESLFNRAIEMDPDSPLPLMYRTKLHLQRGELELAKQDLQRARQMSDDPALAVQLADIYRSLGNMAGAEKIYTEVLDKNPRYEDAVVKLAGLYLAARRWNDLEDLLTYGNKMFPENVELRMIEARMWQMRGDLAKQVGAYAKAKELAPRSKTVVSSYLQALLQAGSHGLVVQTAREYESQEGWGPLMKAYRAAAFARSGNALQADSLFADAIRQAEQGDLSAVLRAVSLAYGPDAALQKIAGWLSVRPDDWLIRFLLADMYKQAQAGKSHADYSRAIDMHKQALALAKDPQARAAIYAELGLLYGMSGMWRQAEEAYKQVLQVRPNDNAALNNLAFIYVDELNEPQKAEPYAKKAYELRPGDHNVADTYGWTLAKLGRYDQAERCLLGSLRIQPQAEARYHLGWVHEQTGRLTESLQQYRLARQLASSKPADDPIRTMIEQAIQRVEEKLADRNQ